MTRPPRLSTLPLVQGDLWVTGDRGADHLVNTDPMALLVGMLLDQQVRLEVAFAGPAKLHRRLGHLDPARLAALPEDELVTVACTPPAIHRYSAVMARRVQALARAVVDEYAGRPERIWEEARNAADLKRRLLALPGFGEEKAMITIAVLAKRFGIRPRGWTTAAGPFADRQPRTVADADSPEALARVRAWKQAQRAAGRSKQDPSASSVRRGSDPG